MNSAAFKLSVLLTAGFFLLSEANALPAGNKLNRLINEQITNHKAGAASQKKVTALAQHTRDLTYKYRNTIRQTQTARAYNRQLRQFIKEQQQENISLREQITEVKKTRKAVIPLMLDMYSTLEKFISLDLPFLLKERQKRLNTLKTILNRADIAISEKYRRLIEAYQIEIQYGKTIEAYQGIQNINGRQLSVNYLRVGRLALIYQTRDESRQAYWDHTQKQWTDMPSRYSSEIASGLQIARKQKAPSLLVVPVPAPAAAVLKKKVL